MAEKQEAKKPSLVACYQVKHYDDGHVEFESIGATPLTEDQIYADIKSLGDQLTKIEKDAEESRKLQLAVAGVVRALMPELVDGVVKAIDSKKAEEKPAVKKLAKEAK